MIALWLACARAPEPAGSGPDLLVVLVGHLRASEAEGFVEALGPGGAPERAYANSPLVGASLASVLVGRRPSAAGVCGVGSRDGQPGPGGFPACHGVPEGLPSLAGVLGLYGYRSLLVTGGIPGGERFAAGFDDHVDVHGWEEADRAVDSWWPGGGPRLVVVALDPLDVLQHPEMLGLAADRTTLLEPLPHGAQDPLAEAAEPLRRRYAAAATAAGEAVASLIDREARVVVAGLSGANLGERSGMNNHSPGFLERGVVLERTVRVPLWTNQPLSAASVELVDLFPTLIGWADAVAPVGLDGAPLGQGTGLAFAECGTMLSVVRGDRRLTFHVPAPDASALDPRVRAGLAQAPGVAGDLEPYALHDVVADPLQEHDLLGEEPAVAAALHAELVAWRSALEAPSARALWELRMKPGAGYW